MQHFDKTPKTLKFLILIMGLVSIASPVVSYFLDHFFQLSGPNVWLSLSLEGIRRKWFWQLITPFFLQSVTYHISLSFLLILALNLFLFWFTGKEIIRIFGNAKFLILFFSAGVFATLLSWAWLFFLDSHELIYGLAPPLLALVVIWLMLYPDMRFHYFHFFRIEAKWIAMIILCLPLLFSLFQFQWGHFFYTLAGILWGYFFGCSILNLNSLFRRRK